MTLRPDERDVRLRVVSRQNMAWLLAVVESSGADKIVLYAVHQLIINALLDQGASTPSVLEFFAHARAEAPAAEEEAPR